MNKAGCAALLLLAVAVTAIAWLWSRAGDLFPTDQVVLFRNIAVAVVGILTFVGLFLLARPRDAQAGTAPVAVQPTRPTSGRRFSFPPALFVVLAGSGTVVWLWFDYQALFPTGRAEQLRRIGIWGVILTCLAGLFRAFPVPSKRAKAVRRSEPHEPRSGNSNSGA